MGIFIRSAGFGVGYVGSLLLLSYLIDVDWRLPWHR